MANRDSRGRFIKGNKAAQGNVGGGRPAREREERYNEIMLTTCSFEDWAAIIVTAVQQAKQGDYRARDFLANYLIGKAALNFGVSPQLGELLEELISLGDEGDDEGDD